MKNEIESIRPKTIFRYLERDKLFKTFLPPLDVGSPSSFEMIVLLSLVSAIRCNNFLEIGTFQGFTSATIAINNPDTNITTIDLPTFKPKFTPEEGILSDGLNNDEYLRNVQNSKELYYFNGLNKNQRNNIKNLLVDSKKLDIKSEKMENFYDIIFIDGGHDLATIENDSRKSLNMRKEKSIIIWHDYNSQIHTDVTKFLNNLSTEIKLKSVIGTSFVIQNSTDLEI